MAVKLIRTIGPQGLFLISIQHDSSTHISRVFVDTVKICFTIIQINFSICKKPPKFLFYCYSVLFLPALEVVDLHRMLNL